MLNQNTYDQLADDFKYFDDPTDSMESQKGSLLPLWRFEYEKAKRLAITAMVWCPQQRDNDLMVVSCGSYDYGKACKGYLLYYRFDFILFLTHFKLSFFLVWKIPPIPKPFINLTRALCV